MLLEIVRACRPYFKKDHRRHRPDRSDQPTNRPTAESTMFAKYDWPLLASESALGPSGRHPIFQAIQRDSQARRIGFALYT